MKKKIFLRVTIALCLFLLAGCGTPIEEGQEIESELDSEEAAFTEETEPSFEPPEDYEETAKQLASDFTIQWAFAYRSNNAEILKALLTNYDNMIAGPYGDIVAAWNNDHSGYGNAWYTYVSGPTVSTVIIQNNQIDADSVHLTVEVSLIGSVELNSSTMRQIPKSVNDRATYDISYDSDGWHFESAYLRLS